MFSCNNIAFVFMNICYKLLEIAFVFCIKGKTNLFLISRNVWMQMSLVVFLYQNNIVFFWKKITTVI